MTQIFDAGRHGASRRRSSRPVRASSSRRRRRRPTATKRCSSGWSKRRRRRSNKPIGRPLTRRPNVPPTRVRREVEARGRAAMRRRPAIRCWSSIFANGERVDVIGTGRGKGFQGVVKRHHFAGGAATHGSMFHRAPGSIGASSFPSRVVKGMRAAGRMGGDRVTIHNLKVAARRPREPPAARRGRHPRRADRLRDRPQGGHGRRSSRSRRSRSREGMQEGRQEGKK